MRAFEATLSFVEGYTSDIFTIQIFWFPLLTPRNLTRKHQVSLNRARNDYRLKVAFLREKAMQLHSLQSNVLCLEINATSATKSTLLDEI
ncbi:hypothetical protein KXD40_003579 [Peronospora effusa]|nr:hypothetical protein KXD40_003579 [Peronospora effusa]